ncbi:MAG: hypothetical protein GWN87_17280, partial [Desulfuromonadales bacterium]|nr:hypothetical protein [Desulfuromonadales bacterium]
FNIRDGLDDYDEDFRTFASLGDIVTADMKHQQELAEARAREQAQARPGAEEVEPVSHGEEEVQAEVSDADESGASAEAAEGEQRADSVAGTDEHVADDDEQSKEATPT